MKALLAAAITSGALILSSHAFAAIQTVRLSIGNFTCAGCAYMVKQTLAEVEGVETVEVSAAKMQAFVTFEDQKTNVPALIAATANAGFPATVIE